MSLKPSRSAPPGIVSILVGFPILLMFGWAVMERLLGLMSIQIPEEVYLWTLITVMGLSAAIWSQGDASQADAIFALLALTGLLAVGVVMVCFVGWMLGFFPLEPKSSSEPPAALTQLQTPLKVVIHRLVG